MAPPPALVASQNQALCGTGVGFTGANPSDITDLAASHGRRRLQSLGRVHKVL